jgi:RHS repeat-associated protein
VTAPIRAAILLVIALMAASRAPASDVVFSYDENGNLTSQTSEGVTTEYLYDIPNRLVEVRRGSNILVRFQYDAEDRILKRIGFQGIRQYAYDGERIQAEYDENGVLVASYSWGRDRLRSINRPGQAALFPQHDGLGSIVALADSQGNVVVRYHYDAWGGLRFPEELTADPNRFGFTGHRWDEEVGFVSTPSRRFDPVLGRFTTQDSYLGQPENPFSLHRYLYGNANPARYTDPTGHWSWEGIAEGLKNLPRAVAEPALWVYDVALVVGAKKMGISSDHIELKSAMGRRQQQRIEEGQGPALAATKGAIEAPAAVFSFGTTSIAQGHYELARSYQKGEISIDEYDRQLSQMAGGQVGAAAVGMGISRAAGRTWTGSIPEAARSNTAHVVAEGREGAVLLPVESAPTSAEPALARFAGASQATDAPVAGPSRRTTGIDTVRWVDEGGNLRAGRSPGMPSDAYEYQSQATGARSNASTGRSQAPRLEYTDATGESATVKFDGLEGIRLIDRKTAIHTGPKTQLLAQRQSMALAKQGLEGVWEVPNASEAARATKLLQDLGIGNITVRIKPR